MLLAAALSLAIAAQAPAPAPDVTLRPVRRREENWILRGSWSGAPRHRILLVMRPTCPKSYRAARRGGYKAASGRVARGGSGPFYAEIAVSAVPAQGRACGYVASADGRRTLDRAVRRYPPPQR